MNALLVYMFKAALYLSAFYLIYSILLSRDTSYGRNRAFILISLAFAMILPNFTLQNFKYFDIQVFGKYLTEVFVTGSPGGNEKLSSGLSTTSLLHLLLLFYLVGAAFFGLKLLTDLINLRFLILRQKNNGSRIVRFHGFNTAGFSAMGYVFINTKLGPVEAEEIIKHEKNHLKRNHFIDIIFLGIIKAFQWFNPSIYLFSRSLRAIHEYQADQECLSSGIPVVNYQCLLLNQVFKTNSFTLTNSFSNPSLVKKRMIMMTKRPTSSIASMKLLAVIPVVGLVFLIVSSFGKISSPNPSAVSSEVTNRKSDPSEEIPYVQVDEMPIFPGGDAALLKFIAEHVKYPENAKRNSLGGRVVVRFCITAKGSINKISILQGVNSDIDAEAIRVIGTLPDFNPGKVGGKAVPVWYMVPITFTLK
jgi:TonB family protein